MFFSLTDQGFFAHDVFLLQNFCCQTTYHGFPTLNSWASRRRQPQQVENGPRKAANPNDLQTHLIVSISSSGGSISWCCIAKDIN